MNRVPQGSDVPSVQQPAQQQNPQPPQQQLPITGPGGSTCQFILGFKILHDLDPTDVGDCIENQAFAPNGDAQQHTTKGLMAWRKADNWTAFTNGYQTWINGPARLVNRLNTERFRFEADSVYQTISASVAIANETCKLVSCGSLVGSLQAADNVLFGIDVLILGTETVRLAEANTAWQAAKQQYGSNSPQAQNAANNWLSRQADWWHALPGIGPLTQIFIPTPVF